MNPSHKDQIIDQVRKIQMVKKEPVKPEWMWDFIRGLGYHDPGREIRRLHDEGLLERYDEGRYGTARTRRPNSLELFA